MRAVGGRSPVDITRHRKSERPSKGNAGRTHFHVFGLSSVVSANSGIIRYNLMICSSDDFESQRLFMSGLILGVDGGQTSTVALLATRAGAILGMGYGGPANHIHEAGGMERMQRSLRDA